MNYMWKFMTNFKEFYNEINSATLTGAIDVIAVQQEDGTYLSSPFHVRFGKIGVLRSREKVVDIEINGEAVGIQMKLGETGEAFFVEETDDQSDVPSYLATSPIPDISEFDREMAIRKGGSCRNTKEDPANVQVVSSSYSEDTVKICQFPDSIDDSSQSAIETNDVAENKDAKKGSSDEQSSVFSSQQSMSLNKTEEASIARPFSNENEADQSENSDRFTSKTKKKRRKRTMKRRSIAKSLDQVDQASAEVGGVENSEDTGEDIFHMDVEDEVDINSTSFKQVVIPPSPSPSQVSHLLCQKRSNVPDIADNNNDWVTLSYKNLQIPHNADGNNTAYSDGEITPIEGGSPAGSRPSTPKSDTEYEMRKMNSMTKDSDSQNQWSWTWGELPVPPQASPVVEHVEPFSDDDSSAKAKQIKKDQEQQRSMFGGMFKLIGMSRTNPSVSENNAENQGMYLDDLSSTDLDPEVAALYLSTNSKWSSQEKGKESTVVTIKDDDDNESGQGSSLPQSPHSVDGAIGGPPTSGVDSDSEEAMTNSELKELNGVAFSVCGNILNMNEEDAFPRFQKSIITYSQFCSSYHNIMNDPDLMVRINGKYYNWTTAAPILISLVVFQKPLPDTLVSDLEKVQSSKTTTKTRSRGLSWFSWRRTDQNEQVVTSSSIVSSKHDDSSDDSSSKGQQLPGTSPSKSLNIEIHSTTIAIEDAADYKLNSENSSPKVNSEKKKLSPGEMYKKSLRLTSEQIVQLNLKDGPNEVVFSVTTAYQGTTRCKCHIYLWRFDDQIVVSDIDGTITKSDVLGHILPIVGKSWAQSGVAQLFTNIKRNGYQFLYLSARAIGQARITRDYLRSVRQGDITLPEGPLLLSPSSLISALHREVIEKRPEDFKISCLRDIQALFPNRNPFYSGYGNKINDVYAYHAVGIPIHRIFTINHKGELKHEQSRAFQSSYSSLSIMVDHLFPPLRYSGGGCYGALTSDFVGAEEFSSFTYWREPLPDIEISLNILPETEENQKK